MERYVATQFYKADSPESRILRESGIAPSEFVLAADAQATIAALQARVRELEHRLEIDVALDIDGNEIPAPPNMPDGIYCRNATIQLQNEALSELEAQLAQRTAELEAIERILDIDSGKTTVEKVRDLHHSFKQVWDSYQDASNEMFKAQAELERVRGLVKALPKVEGAVVFSNGYVKDSTRCHALFGADEDAALYAALLQHRQGME